MNWEKEHPEVMRATAEFVRVFESVPDPVVASVKKAETLEAKIAWTLFGSCIAQEIPLYLLQKVLITLFKTFPSERLWSFPIPTEKEIRMAVRKAKGSYDWPLEKSVPGIFFSVGNFVRRRIPLVGWASATSYKGILRDLGEIFFMGKGAYRPKGISATSRLFSDFPRGFGVPRTFNPEDVSPVPFSFGARRWIGFIGPGKEIGFSEMDEPQKRKLAASLFKALSRKDPRIAAHAFQFFLEPSGKGFFCADETEQCKKCPLSPFCSRSFQNEKA